MLSFVNTRLRDNYASLDELCDDLNVNPADLSAALVPMGVEYIPGLNQFR